MGYLAWMCGYLDKVAADLREDHGQGFLYDEANVKVRKARLNDIDKTLRELLRNLNNSESLFRSRESRLKKIPREARWSAKQSVESGLDEIEEVKRRAQALETAIIDMLKETPNPFQLTLKGIELVENIRKAVDEHQGQIFVCTTQELAEGVLTTVPHVMPDLRGVPVVLFLAFAFLKWQRNSHSAKEAKENSQVKSS